MRILILGATSPIARALAAEFAREDGADLYLAARDAAEGNRVAQDLSVRSERAVHSGTFDAADYNSHPDFVRGVIERLGGLDGIVVAFGTLGDETTAQSDPAEALKTIAANFTGAVSIMTLAAEHLKAQGHGFIIVLASVAGDRGRAKNYVYGSAKGALALFTGGLRGRLANSGVHVMTVKLGFVDTRMTYGQESGLTASPAQAAQKIHAKWRRGAEVVYIPSFWRPIMAAIRMVPERFFKRLSF
jgi:short-subunit dehydrogenase